MEGHGAQEPWDEPEEVQESLGTTTGRTACDKPKLGSGMTWQEDEGGLLGATGCNVTQPG